MEPLKKLALVLVVPSILINFYLFSRHNDNTRSGSLAGTPTPETGFMVVDVWDGDTIVLEGNLSIRLANINAPEPEDWMGAEAKARLEELTLEKRVRLKESRADRMSRLIALVYQGDRLINELMLEEGYGRYDSTGTSMDEAMLLASHRARDAGRGVYTSCVDTPPENSKCLIKGNIDKKRGKKVYHFPGCSGYPQVILELDRGERWFCSEGEAREAGFERAETCYGKAF